MDTEVLRDLDSTNDILAALNNLTIAMRRRIIALDEQLSDEVQHVRGDGPPMSLGALGLVVTDIEKMDVQSLDTLRTALLAVHRGFITTKGKRNGGKTV